MIKKIIPLAISLLLIVGVLVVVALSFHWNFTGSKPVQPINFSHNLHIETVGLECDHCHAHAAESKHAGIPAVSVCMDCHESVATDRPEVKKLIEYWNKKEPIPWLKVHRQPWHVHFTHKRHIKAKIECTTCHGEVKAMTTVRKVRSLDMGWCVACHRDNGASTDCLTCHK